MLMFVTRIAQTYVVRITFKGSAVVAHLYLAKTVPSHQRLWKLERTVLNQLGIETAICTKINVLKKESVHGGLNGCTLFFYIDYKIDGLSLCEDASRKT
ncbi:hypothetical protein SDC9_183559 [bioreactor metagenome]|uniref:Uncharacterized protein n=1 Tax=bioreactor metagenome TaxID=1076179 RepID=A0A645HIV5_9ZZZZ